MVARALTRVETSAETYLADRLYQYGEASGVALSLSDASVVANGKSRVTVTATVIDSEGRRVRNYGDQLVLEVDSPAVTVDGNQTVRAEQRVAR